MTRKLAALLAVLLAALAAASLTVGLLYWALDGLRRRPPSPAVPLLRERPGRNAPAVLPAAAPRVPGPRPASPGRLPWH